MGKFNVGDTIAINAKVTYSSFYDDAVDAVLDTGTRVTLSSADARKATLVKKAVPETPKARTVIDYVGAKYIVTTGGGLAYVYSDGTTDPSAGKWSELDHSSGNVTILG